MADYDGTGRRHLMSSSSSFFFDISLFEVRCSWASVTCYRLIQMLLWVVLRRGTYRKVFDRDCSKMKININDVKWQTYDITLNVIYVNFHLVVNVMLKY